MTQGIKINRSTVVSVPGSVVVVRFEQLLLPIFAVLRAGTDGKDMVEVTAQLDGQRVQGIALTPPQSLARGMTVQDTGSPLPIPVGKKIVSRMFDVFGHAIDRRPKPVDVVGRSIHRLNASPNLRSSKRVSMPSMF